MRISAKRQRLIFVTVAALLCVAGALVILSAFRDNIIFFYTPAELQQHPEAAGKPLRIGGLVEAGSVARAGTICHFIITDGTAELPVAYTGTLPDLFREGQGVVAEGKLKGGTLVASRILAKHDERYMPKEVADRLKKTGRWRGTP